jgi:hypothetical protein
MSYSVVRRAHFAIAAAALFLLSAATHAQTTYSSGQNVVPVFEGWERQSDGGFSMLFGYFNRNSEEVIDVPIGPANRVEPGASDQGQPTHFYPLRNRYWFKVKVPADFGAKELVWTLTVGGKTEHAYATLKPEYAIDDSVKQLDTAGINLWWAEAGVNKAPDVTLQGDDQRHAKVGEPLDLVAIVHDDGIPPAPKNARGRTRYTWFGLRVAWFVDRGAGKVYFAPEQFKVYPDYDGNSPWTAGWTAPLMPADGRYPVKVTFSSPGEYIIRAMAHDGGLATTKDVRVVVTE